MPPGVRAELIDGVVNRPSPVGYDRGSASHYVGMWLGFYSESTPGTRVHDNATAILGWRSELQPDVHLCILPEYGGRTRNEGLYVAGPPELVVEISATSRYVDLGPKLAEYDRAGVLEYVVLALAPDEVIWHARRDYLTGHPDQTDPQPRRRACRNQIVAPSSWERDPGSRPRSRACQPPSGGEDTLAWPVRPEGPSSPGRPPTRPRETYPGPPLTTPAAAAPRSRAPASGRPPRTRSGSACRGG